MGICVHTRFEISSFLKVPSLYKEIKKRNSVVKSRWNAYLKIVMDQDQEYNNKKIKSSYINVVNKDYEQFIQKLEVCCPEVLSYLYKVVDPPKA